MRTVFTNNEIPHLWAHQSQSHARNANDSYSFKGTRLYSYTTCIAEIVTNKRGESAAVLSRRSYSITTSSHQSGAWSAVSHMHRLFVHTVWSSPESQRAEFAESIRLAMDAIADAKNRVSRAKRHGAAQAIVNRANEYCEFFGLKRFAPIPESEQVVQDIAAIRAREEKTAAIRRKRQAAEYAKREIERRRDADERLSRWLAGENVSAYGLSTAYMRLTADGETIETTMGATVPVEHVRRVAPLVLRLIASGGTYRRNGHTIHLGHYALDSIDENGTVKAGCHTFERAEIIRIAGLLGVTAETTV